MKTAAIVFFTAWFAYTGWCCAYGPPYHDAYGEIVHAAYWMDYSASKSAGHYVSR